MKGVILRFGEDRVTYPACIYEKERGIMWLNKLAYTGILRMAVFATTTMEFEGAPFDDMMNLHYLNCSSLMQEISI